MRRRALLTALAAGATTLAGCSGTFSNPRETPDTVSPVDPPRNSPRETSTDPGDPEIGGSSIVDFETNGHTYTLAPLRYRSDDGGEVRMGFSSTATTDTPATIEATLSNENPFANTFDLEETPPFGRLSSDQPRRLGNEYPEQEHTYRVGLVFAPTANHELVDNPPELELASDGHWRLVHGVDQWLPNQVRLDAGETVSGEYALVGRGDGVNRGRPQGVYAFSRADEQAVRVSVWETRSPGPDMESRFTGASLPPLPGDSGTAWFHDAGPSTPSFVRPSIERTGLPARIQLTFINRSRESTSCGHWNLFKLHDDAWYPLGPFVQTADCRSVQPGDAKVWTMRAAADEMAPCEATGYPFLGGGRYAAVAGYGHRTSRSAALVLLEARELTVRPTDDVTTERTDGTVTATSDRWRSAPENERRSQVELTLERTDHAERSLIAEQVMRPRFRGLRNTLAFVSEAERVVLRTNDRVADRVVAPDDGIASFRFEEQPYTITVASE